MTAAPANPDQLLLSLCSRWHALYRQWQGELSHYRLFFGGANDLYRREIAPLTEKIAGPPSAPEEGFQAKIAILLEYDLCSVVACISKQQHTECVGWMTTGKASMWRAA